MMEEFALCWNKLKFAENLSTGFQSLYDRGDFVDCTIAVDGQILHCHKLVLAICSPYFREIFISNPCRHPIIILKDVTYSIMSELLQFMYQGEVNVKQAELQSFMSIAESLQIKGLATSGNSNVGGGGGNTMKGTDPINSSTSFSQFHANNAGIQRNHHQFNSGGNHTENHRQTTSTPLSTTSSLEHHATQGTMKGKHASININNNNNGNESTAPASTSSYPQKRRIDQIDERQSQMRIKLSVHDASDSDMNDSIDNMNHDDIFLPTAMQPQVTINESPRYDTSSATTVKREGNDGVVMSRPQSPVYRNTYNSSNSMQTTSFPYFTDFSSGDQSINSNNGSNNGSIDMSKSHMDVPPAVLPGERWFNGKLEFMLSQRGKPLLVHDGFSFGIQYIRKDKKYWQCNLSRKYNCKARVTTTDAGDIIVTNNEHCHTEIRQHLRKDYKMNKLQAQLNNQLNNHHHHHHLANYAVGIERKIGNLASYMGQSVTSCLAAAAAVVASSSSPISTISTTQTSIMPSRQTTTTTNSYPKNLSLRSPSITPEPPAEHHRHHQRDDNALKRE